MGSPFLFLISCYKVFGCEWRSWWFALIFLVGTAEPWLSDHVNLKVSLLDGFKEKWGFSNLHCGISLTFSLTCNSFLTNGSSTLTNCSWVLLHIDQRPLHVWWHRVIRWYIFHMAFLRHNSTYTGIKISIIHTGIQWYLTYLFSNICSQLSSEDAFDTHFSVVAFRQGQSDSLICIIKGFRCVFPVFTWWKSIITKLWRAAAAQFWCKVQDEYAWLHKILPPPPVAKREGPEPACTAATRVSLSRV